MRILNRPMFKYGGPIKEGVMHGMKNGGTAGVGYGLVGDQRYPKTGGREHHVAFLGALPWAARALPWAARGLRAGWKYLKPTSIPRNIVTKSKSTLPIGMRGTMGSRTTTVPRSNWQMSKEWMKANPGYTLTGGLSAYNAPGTYGAVKGLAGAAGSAVKQVADLAVPDWIWDQDKWEKERAERQKPPTDIMKPGGFEKVIPEIEIDKKSPEEMAAEAKAARTKKLNKYLDTMGYDTAKRGALDKALIDASAIVQDATTEAGSLKKADWSKMINKAIQTTSKRLEKPEQIREAVGLMLTKSEIEKDMNADENKLNNDYKRMQIKLGEKSLAGTSFEDIISDRMIKNDMFKGNDLASLLRIKKGVDAKVISTAGMDADQDALTYVTQLIEEKEGTPYPEGVYVISDRIISVDAQGNVKKVL